MTTKQEYRYADSSCDHIWEGADGVGICDVCNMDCCRKCYLGHLEYCVEPKDSNKTIGIIQVKGKPKSCSVILSWQFPRFSIRCTVPDCGFKRKILFPGRAANTAVDHAESDH